MMLNAMSMLLLMMMMMIKMMKIIKMIVKQLKLVAVLYGEPFAGAFRNCS